MNANATALSTTDSLTPEAQRLYRLIRSQARKNQANPAIVGDMWVLHKARLSPNELVRSQQELKASGLLSISQGRHHGKYHIHKGAGCV